MTAAPFALGSSSPISSFMGNPLQRNVLRALTPMPVWNTVVKKHSIAAFDDTMPVFLPVLDTAL